MSIKDLYPIGTVVVLKDGEKKLLIVGVKQLNADTKEEYDYLAVTFPEGFLGGDVMVFFNHDAIGELYHLGLKNEEQEAFLEALDDFYKSQTEE